MHARLSLSAALQYDADSMSTVVIDMLSKQQHRTYDWFQMPLFHKIERMSALGDVQGISRKGCCF